VSPSSSGLPGEKDIMEGAERPTHGLGLGADSPPRAFVFVEEVPSERTDKE